MSAQAVRSLGFLRLGEVIAGMSLGAKYDDVVLVEPATPRELPCEDYPFCDCSECENRAAADASHGAYSNVATYGFCGACERYARLDGPIWRWQRTGSPFETFAECRTCSACGSTRQYGPDYWPSSDFA